MIYYNQLLDELDVALASIFRQFDEALQSSTGPGDRFPGLHIDSGEVARLLAREPRAPAPGGAGGALTARALRGTPLEALGQMFGLAPDELDVVLVALAVELDPKYERVFAYLQDDLTRRRPTVELVGRVLGATGCDPLLALRRLDPAAPLVARRLVELVADPNQVRPPLLSQCIKLDDQVFRFLVGQTGLDPRLAPCARVTEADRAADPPSAGSPPGTIAARVLRAERGGAPPRFHLDGPRGAGKRSLALGVARGLGRPALHVDLERLRCAPQALAGAAPLVAREAALRGAVLVLDGCDLFPEGDPALGDLLALVEATTGPVVMCSHRPWAAYRGRLAGVARVPVPVPGPDERRRHWAARLGARGVELPADELDALARRVEFGPGHIRDAVAVACLAHDAPSGADLAAAARDLTGHELEALAERLEPRAGWDDLILPADVKAQLECIETRVRHRRHVLDDWGYGEKLSYGTGTLVLFAGASGTGKTMAAEALAARLGLGLYRVDPAALVSKYIGETEKNCERLFAAARRVPGVLFFDEADALFARRTEIRDAHDRYANLETAYLLQRAERCDTPVVLATNLIENIDDAFLRRVTDVVRFPFPDAAHRLRIWERAWPDRGRLAPAVSLPAVAARFELSGGSIKNVALAASFYAAGGSDARVGTGHLARAIRDEYRKLGTRIDAAEVERGLRAEGPTAEPRPPAEARHPDPSPPPVAGVRP